MLGCYIVCLLYRGCRNDRLLRRNRDDFTINDVSDIWPVDTPPEYHDEDDTDDYNTNDHPEPPLSH
jgi:hypothetical protein